MRVRAQVDAPEQAALFAEGGGRLLFVRRAGEQYGRVVAQDSCQNLGMGGYRGLMTVWVREGREGRIACGGGVAVRTTNHDDSYGEEDPVAR